jgi:hypothetical protein
MFSQYKSNIINEYNNIYIDNKINIPTNIIITLFIIIISIFIKKKLNKKSGYKEIPYISGGYPFFGNVFEMINGSPWNVMTDWATKHGNIYKMHMFGSDCICVSDPTLLQVILQSKYNIFKKDLGWTYKPFLCILGNGLVTADGSSWRKQRVLLSSYLRLDILDDIPDISYRAYNRLCIYQSIYQSIYFNLISLSLSIV